MTEGDRIVQEFSPRMGLTVAEEEELARRIDAAVAERDQRVRNMQNVDADVRAEYLRFEQRALQAEAALAEREAQITARTRQVERWQHAAHEGCASGPDGTLLCEPASPGDFARAIHRAREAEAQIAALREALQELVDALHARWITIGLDKHLLDTKWLPLIRPREALANTAPAARAFVERIRAEERERAAQVADTVVKQWTHLGDYMKTETTVARAQTADAIAVAIRALPPRRGT